MLGLILTEDLPYVFSLKVRKFKRVKLVARSPAAHRIRLKALLPAPKNTPAHTNTGYTSI